ncbi:MAG: hypothetical protein QXF12_05595, partial [Candidatus Aenigmatarchaeota archaeon]
MRYISFALFLVLTLSIVFSQEFSYTIPSTNINAGKVIGYRSRAVDIDGNTNVSQTFYFTVQS